MQSHILSIILFTPLVGAILLMFVPKDNKDAIRWIANLFALGGFLISLPLVPWFWAQRFQPGFKFMEGAPNNWIPSIGAGYVLGIDGISFLLIMLTTLARLGFDPFLLDRHREPRQGVLHLVSDFAGGHVGRVYVARLLPVLCFLGSHARPHVSADRHLGRPAQALCRHQVLPLHAVRLRADAAVGPVPLLL